MHPEFIRIGNFAINTYGVLVATGFLLGLLLAARRARREGLNPALIGDLGVWVIIAGMLGAKLFHVVFFWDEFLKAWREAGIASLREGFVFYGGFIAACLTTIVFAWRRKVPLWQLADIMAPSVALGHVFGRLGCFFNGCCYGRHCYEAWAVNYPAGHAMRGIPVHPTQIYEALGNLALFGWLTYRWPRKRFSGEIWWCYVLSYGLLRFAIEFWRGDYAVHYFGIFTLGHAVAAAMILIAIAALVIGRPRTPQHQSR